MDKRLENLYNECIKELEILGFKIVDNPEVGKIDITLSEKNLKRYGCCRQVKPDKNYYHIVKRKYKNEIVYDRFKEHHIEISRWVMELNEDLIKNVIIHEILHCLPACNNHGVLFKNYANYINQKLGYNITTKGNVEEDYIKSNLNYNKEKNCKYKITCKECGEVFYRQRLKKDLIKKYRCSKCGGKLELNHLN